eukprot:m.228044 g.228044  ORF g.228044 m.228044 type:complete len:704 (-) comp15187_c0_seq9:328-2439(-)
MATELSLSDQRHHGAVALERQHVHPSLRAMNEDATARKELLALNHQVTQEAARLKAKFQGLRSDIGMLRGYNDDELGQPSRKASQIPVQSREELSSWIEGFRSTATATLKHSSDTNFTARSAQLKDMHQQITAQQQERKLLEGPKLAHECVFPGVETILSSCTLPFDISQREVLLGVFDIVYRRSRKARSSHNSFMSRSSLLSHNEGSADRQQSVFGTHCRTSQDQLLPIWESWVATPYCERLAQQLFWYLWLVDMEPSLSSTADQVLVSAKKQFEFLVMHTMNTSGGSHRRSGSGIGSSFGSVTSASNLAAVMQVVSQQKQASELQQQQQQQKTQQAQTQHTSASTHLLGDRAAGMPRSTSSSSSPARSASSSSAVATVLASIHAGSHELGKTMKSRRVSPTAATQRRRSLRRSSSSSLFERPLCVHSTKRPTSPSSPTCTHLSDTPPTTSTTSTAAINMVQVATTRSSTPPSMPGSEIFSRTPSLKSQPRASVRRRPLTRATSLPAVTMRSSYQSPSSPASPSALPHLQRPSSRPSSRQQHTSLQPRASTSSIASISSISPPPPSQYKDMLADTPSVEVQPADEQRPSVLFQDETTTPSQRQQSHTARKLFWTQFPSFLSQSLVCTYVACFPESSGVGLGKSHLARVTNLVYEWLEGVRPATRVYEKWDLEALHRVATESVVHPTIIDTPALVATTGDSSF